MIRNAIRWSQAFAISRGYLLVLLLFCQCTPFKYTVNTEETRRFYAATDPIKVLRKEVAYRAYLKNQSEHTFLFDRLEGSVIVGSLVRGKHRNREIRVPIEDISSLVLADENAILLGKQYNVSTGRFTDQRVKIIGITANGFSGLVPQTAGPGYKKEYRFDEVTFVEGTKPIEGASQLTLFVMGVLVVLPILASL
jgi:hypothetical protein